MELPIKEHLPRIGAALKESDDPLEACEDCGSDYPYQLMFRDDEEPDNPQVTGTFQVWSLVDPDGEIATRVWFSPDGQEPVWQEPD